MPATQLQLQVQLSRQEMQLQTITKLLTDMLAQSRPNETD